MPRVIGPPRGLLAVPSTASVGPGRHRRIAPSAALEDLVQHYWCVSWDQRGLPPIERRSLPFPHVHLVFEADAARIHGFREGRFSTMLSGQGWVFGVKFRPAGFRGFLDAPLSDLRGESRLASAVFGADVDSLRKSIYGATSDDDRVTLVEAFLLRRRPAADPQADRLSVLVDEIAADPTLLSVDAVCARHGISPRALQRSFREYVGVTPKRVILRYRLHEALARMEGEQRPDWVRLAADLGYADQAHFIRDFKAAVGQTPAAYALSLQR
ncbi:MAG: helix-turn-helix transcriptional regulator [Xanthomonadales bacterium]|nr:helix-turn-helix transcriptional regulator [Xanthomonadales bacterium]